MTSAYEIKNLKHFAGEEDQGFSLTLYQDGKRVATVRDPGDGSIHLNYTWIQEAAARPFFDHARAMFDRSGQPLEPQLRIFADSLFIEELIEAHERAAEQRQRIGRIQKLLGTQLVTVDGQTVRTHAIEPTVENVARVQRELPEVVVLNTVPLDLAIAYLQAVSEKAPRPELPMPVVAVAT